jgi:hypothetical protein
MEDTNTSAIHSQVRRGGKVSHACKIKKELPDWMNLKPVIKSFLCSREFSGGGKIQRAIVIPPLRGYRKHFRVDIGKRLVWKYIAGHL